MKIFSKSHRVIIVHALVGAFIGILLLHPVTKIVYWFEFRHDLRVEDESLWHFLVTRLEAAFILEMVPMSLAFALIGGSIGIVFAMYHVALSKQQRTVQYLQQELAEDLPSLIKNGEGEHLEFKASVRWDFRQNKLNRALENVIAKTIAGFLNHHGGSLLVGVTDDGEISGLEHDYKTFKQKNRDGFERCIMDIVTTRLGTDLCSGVHCVFYEIEGKDVCRVIIESSITPVYLLQEKVSKYYMRAGNATRELDAREAVSHLTRQ